MTRVFKDKRKPHIPLSHSHIMHDPANLAITEPAIVDVPNHIPPHHQPMMYKLPTS
jgi:hypothetical protein